MILRFLTIAIGLTLFAAPSLAQNLAHLRTNCSGFSNCFTNMTALSEWLWEGGRNPPPSFVDPVTVIVGLGDHTGRLSCAFSEVAGDMGFVTLRGESRTGSRLVGTDTSGLFPSAIHVASCDELDFQNLTIVAPNVQLGIGVTWAGSGDSRWLDVDLSANYLAWYDTGCTGPSTDPPTGLHSFQYSTLTARGVAWLAGCGEGLIYESQLNVVATNDSANYTTGAFGVGGSYLAEVYLLESDVTVDVSQRSAASTAVGLDSGTTVAGSPTGSGEVEMFGGTLTVKGNPDDTLHGARARKFSETAEPATVKIQGTKLVLQNGTAAANVSSGDGEVERVDLAH